MWTIFAAGLLCGVLDGMAAVGVAAASGTRPFRVFQFIASAVLGRSAFGGGRSTMALGMVLHFAISLSAAAVYFGASRYARVLVDDAVLAGPLYGMAIHLVMAFLVLPLTAAERRPFQLQRFLVMLMVHMIVVGPSIALTVRRYA